MDGDARSVDERKSVVIDSDSPTEHDTLGRDRYVDALFDVVREAQTPVVIALYGSWGTGKTSLMMQLQRRIDTTPAGSSASKGNTGGADSSMRTVWFNPWMHQFDDNPALGFLYTTVEQLGIAQEGDVLHALTKIGIAMTEDLQIPYIGLKVGKLLKLREELARDELSRHEERARLEKRFKTVIDAATQSGTRRLVFFIDDLDRCQPKIALGLLEALKLYFSFNNCVFVLGVDREPLEAAVASEYKTLGLSTESYLDKIIQLPFTIPAIDDAGMRSLVEAQLPDVLHSCRPILAAAAADVPREVKRAANSLLLNHRLALEKIPADDYKAEILALVVLVQNYAPALYRQLRLKTFTLQEVYSSRNYREEEGDRGQDLEVQPAETLWDSYLAGRPRLQSAMALVDVSPELNLEPYLTLTHITTGQPIAEMVPSPIAPVAKDGFLTEQGIEGIIRQSGLLGTGEEVVSYLPLLRTRRQHTWLVSTTGSIFCLLDDRGRARANVSFSGVSLRVRL